MRLTEITNTNQAPKLPPTPEGCLRHTNVTNSSIARKVTSGEPYKYGKNGISNNTDSWGKDDDISNFLLTRKSGPYDRTSFGDSIIILDIPYDEARVHARRALSPTFVDNSRVLGYVDTTKNKFIKNPNYNPTKAVEYPEQNTPHRGPSDNLPSPGSKPEPQVTTSADSNTDIW